MTPKTAFDAPADDRWLEDYVQGTQYIFGPIHVDPAELHDFAMRYDPQPFHIDPDAAKAGPYGQIIASGWMTAALVMRLYVEHVASRSGGMAAPGVDELRWLKPVFGGDQLHLRLTILSARASASKPWFGLVAMLMEGINQHGDCAYSCKALTRVRRNPKLIGNAPPTTV